jgi:hypothetical protein
MNGRKLTKYPRTYHLPWSPGATGDDKVLRDVSQFHGRHVVVTKKMDGENSTIYQDGYVHARSLDSAGGVDRDWVKSFAQQWCFNLPEGWRVCGENLWAKHSIQYDDLPSYFLGFSAWNEENTCLSWDETVELFDRLGIIPVPVLYDGVWDVKAVRALEKDLDFSKDEGYVVRLADSFKYDEFSSSVAKYVRAGHVQTDTHWRHSKLVQNRLK